MVENFAQYITTYQERPTIHAQLSKFEYEKILEELKKENIKINNVIVSSATCNTIKEVYEKGNWVKIPDGMIASDYYTYNVNNPRFGQYCLTIDPRVPDFLVLVEWLNDQGAHIIEFAFYPEDWKE